MLVGLRVAALAGADCVGKLRIDHDVVKLLPGVEAE